MKRFRLTEERRLGTLLAVGLVVSAVSLAACASDGEAGEAGGQAGNPTDGPTGSPASGAVSEETGSAAALKLHTVVRAPMAVGITFDSRGRLVYAEKDSGRIIRVSKGRKSVLARLNVASGGEDGLLGLAIDSGGRYYASYTGGVSGCPNPTSSGSAGGGLEAHCVWRFVRSSTGKLRADGRVFAAGHPNSASNHVGGGIHFDKDGALLLTIGDLGENDDPNNGPGRSQDVDGPYGKMLRLDPAGNNQAAAGNPGYCNNVANTSRRTAGDARVFACGLRNVWEFAVAGNGKIWGAEAGDGCDEINVIKAGVNYGWEPPRTDCAGQGDGKAIIETSGTPSGIDVWEHAAAGSWRGDVFYCLYADGGKMVRYDVSAHRRSTVRAAGGHCLLDVTGGRRGLYLSDGEKILRLTR